MENKVFEKKVRIINLPHLCWYFLQQVIMKWYIFFIIILAGTIAGAGYAVVKNANQDKMQNEEYVSITEEEFVNIQNAEKLYDALEEQKEYNEQSILMKCSNLTFSQAVAVYRVQADDEYKSHQIAAMFMNLFDGKELYQKVADDMETDIEIKYIKEVFETVSLENGLFEVKTVSFSTENAMQMLEAAGKYLQEQKSTIEKDSGDSYDIELLSTVASESIADDLKEKKDNADTALTELQSAYDSAFAALSYNGQKYFYLYLNARTNENYVDGEALEIIENSDIPKTENSLAKRRLIIDTCLGFVLGVCCACGYFIIKYCWAEKLVNGEELTGMYGVPILGCFIDEKKREGIYFWFLKKQKKSFDLKEQSQECREIIARLCLRFSKEDRIYLVSTYQGGEKFENLLIEEAKKQGITLVKGTNLLRQTLEYSELKNSDQVLFIEKEGVSRYQDIDKEIQLSYEAGKKVCGAVIIV